MPGVKCDRCKKELVFGAIGPDRSRAGTLARRTVMSTRVGGDPVGYAVEKQGGEGEVLNVEVLCLTCDGLNLLPKAREAGANEAILSALETNVRLHGPAPAFFRAIADVLHDGRPLGNDRSDYAWKMLSTAHAQARRLAEIMAAPR